MYDRINTGDANPKDFLFHKFYLGISWHLQLMEAYFSAIYLDATCFVFYLRILLQNINGFSRLSCDVGKEHVLVTHVHGWLC